MKRRPAGRGPAAAAREADFVIVGGGSAGCVLADRLSASGRHRVLVIEAGGRDRNPWLHIPIGYGKLMRHPGLDWGFETVPQPQLDDRRIAAPRGRVLGGSSATNGLAYIRGQAEDYDAWARAGNIGWGYADLLPYFRRGEDQQRGADRYHGVGGPLLVSDPATRLPLCDAFIAAAVATGIPENPDFNGATQEGVGYYQATARGRLRSSTATGYLRRARGRPNLEIMTDTEVERIRFEGTRAAGVVCRQGDTRMEATARREILLCAGGIVSPKLLMLSGVGDAAVLAELGIRTVAHRPAVGMSLQDHVNVRTSYRCALPITLNDRLGTAWGRAMAGLEYLALGRGPLTVAAGTGGAFFRSDGASGRPDVQAFLLVFRTDRMGTRLSPDSGFMMSAYQLRPHSRGSIRLASPDPRAPPLIDPAYLASDFDRAVTLAGLRRLQAIASARPLADLIAGPSEPPLDADDSTLTAHIRASASPGHHFCGSCRMGPDPDSVVDPRLRVRGTSGLRVADASIMPAVVSGNTLAPVVAIAEKAADMILADAR